jgi:hypothetical protein
VRHRSYIREQVVHDRHRRDRCRGAVGGAVDIGELELHLERGQLLGHLVVQFVREPGALRIDGSLQLLREAPVDDGRSPQGADRCAQ